MAVMKDEVDARVEEAERALELRFKDFDDLFDEKITKNKKKLNEKFKSRVEKLEEQVIRKLSDVQKKFDKMEMRIKLDVECETAKVHKIQEEISHRSSPTARFSTTSFNHLGNLGNHM
jgi:hypothetical protein